MINLELKKRIITSIVLLTLLVLMYLYVFVLIISLIIISLIAWIEFYGLISKIFKKQNKKNTLLRFIYKAFSLLYLSLLVFFSIIAISSNSELEVIFFYSLLVSIMSDIGGLVVGKIFKGNKLTKISPNKTISGSIGSFVFSLFLIPLFMKSFISYDLLALLLVTLIISFISQVGDLLISFIKRKAKVKNTSDLLPGHGGILDRIDGIIFAIPFGFIIFKFL